MVVFMLEVVVSILIIVFMSIAVFTLVASYKFQQEKTNEKNKNQDSGP